MSNLNKFRKSTVAILTALLLIAIAAPLMSFAVAAGAPTATLGTVSGPNGTLIKVDGTGFLASKTVGAGDIWITVDGLAGKADVTTSILPASQLATDASGVLSGYFIIYGLSVGPHTVMIGDTSTSVVAGTFTITAPTVTVTPSPIPAGTSVTVSASGFPAVNALVAPITNVMTAASFAGTSISVAAGKTTGTATTLSSNVISATGAFTATVSLPVIANVPTFTLTDSWGNTATTTITLTNPTVTLSPTSGPVGTVVTATVTGFGPSSTIASVKVGNVAASLETATFYGSNTNVAATTEQGTSVFLFVIPAGTTTTKAGVVGSQAVFVADALGNIGNTTFTVTPKVTITTGTAATDSGTTYVPASTVANLRISLSGFKANSALTITASPGIPTEWITPTSSWSPNTQITSGVLKTDANGAVATVATVEDTNLDFPTSIGQYTITISDGTNAVTTTINVITAGDILVATTPSGAVGQAGVQLTYFGTTPTGVTLGGVTCANGGFAAGQAWPTPTTATFTVAAGSAGVRTLALVGGTFNTVAFTTVSPSITVISPSSAAVGTTVTVAGTGFANVASTLALQGATVSDDSAIFLASGNNVITTFTVPNYLPGVNTLSVSDGANTATASLTVTAPAVQITPTTGAPTTALGGAVTIAITGSGFRANAALTVKFDTTTIGAGAGGFTGLTTTNTNGGIILLSGYALPTSTTAGTHTVYVLDAVTGAYATATYTVTPKLTAPTTAVRPGAQVAITGIGFAANSIQSLTVNGTATNWVIVSTTPATPITQTTVVTGTTGDLYTTSSVGFVVPSTTASGVLVIAVTDAANNVATKELTILGTPSVTLGASNIVAGTIATGVTIAGAGFTPGSSAVTANLYSGSTLTAAAVVTGSPATVGASGSFGALGTVKFTVPASVVAGTYTLRVTVGTESADATITVMSAPTITAPTSAVSGGNVTITVTGLSAISTATFSSTNLLPASFGSTTIPSKGESAFTTTTWFILPTGIFAGTYLLTLTDANTGLSVQTAITVQPTMALSIAAGTTWIKGTTVTVTGTGFAATPATVSAKLNGQAIALSSTAITAAGGITPTFVIPITATATNTLTVTDSAGNTASATFTLTVPTITLDKETAAVGSTVQILGSGFTAASQMVIQVGGQIVATTPATLTATGGSFMGYFAVPAGLTGNVTVTAADSSNNIATAYFTVSTSSGGVPNQSTMTSTAQTTTPSGTATTTFTAGSTVKASFVLQSTSGSRDVVVAVTWQQGAKVYNMASFQTTMTTTASAVSFSNLVPAGATGTWTATLQVFDIDGVTPLGVTTLTFTVS